MDPVGLAGEVLAVLAPFLRKGLEQAAGKAGEALSGVGVDGVKRLYAAVRERFAGDESGGAQLERWVGEPASPVRQRALEGTLADLLDRDPVFAERVRGLLEQARPAAAGGVRAGRADHVEGAAAVGGDLTIQAGEGGTAAGRDAYGGG